VQIDVEAWTVALTGSFASVRSAQRFPLGGKGYWRLTILLFHIISARPCKQPLMVRTFLKVFGAWLLDVVPPIWLCNIAFEHMQ